MEFPGFHGHPKTACGTSRRATKCRSDSTRGVHGGYTNSSTNSSRPIARYDVKQMCSTLGVTRSGCHAGLHNPISKRMEEDARLLRLIRASYKASHGIYG